MFHIGQLVVNQLLDPGLLQVVAQAREPNRPKSSAPAATKKGTAFRASDGRTGPPPLRAATAANVSGDRDAAATAWDAPIEWPIRKTRLRSTG